MNPAGSRKFLSDHAQLTRKTHLVEHSAAIRAARQQCPPCGQMLDALPPVTAAAAATGRELLCQRLPAEVSTIKLGLDAQK